MSQKSCDDSLMLKDDRDEVNYTRGNEAGSKDEATYQW